MGREAVVASVRKRGREKRMEGAVTGATGREKKA